MDSSTYRHLSGQIKNSCPIPHYNFPSHNLLSVETLFKVSKDLKGDEPDWDSEFLPTFPCYQPFPYAVQQSAVLFCGSCTTDDANKLVKKKLQWEKELKNLRVSNIDTVVRNIKRMRQNKVTKLSIGVKKYIEHFHWDPEPMFSGNYNWLYTGGCLCHDKKSDDTYLISGDFVGNKPGFNFLQLSKSQDKIMQKSFCELKAYMPVLQITCRSRMENLIISVRQKNHLSLFNADRINFLSQPVRLWRKKVACPKLLTCVDVESSCEKVIISDSNFDINVFDIERKNKIYGQSGRNIADDFSGDVWSQIEFGELGVYWALRNRFVIFDLRDFCLGTILNVELSTTTNPCESISSFAKSQSDANFVYFSTTHSVLQVDLRNGKTVQRWTHLMKNPPQFMEIVKDKEESEVLLLQSPSVDEISGITNKCIKDGGNVNFVSKSPVYLLKNMKESLNSARIRGMCLSPSIAKRVDFHVTGMQCLKNSQGDINLFTTNSGGDVFLSKIRSRVSESFLADEKEDEIIDEMKIYESELEEFPLKNPNGSQLEVIDMSSVLKDFQHSKPETTEDKKRKMYWKFHEMYSFKSLNLFQDFMAQKTIKVWIPPEVRFEDLDLEAEIRSIEAKVMEWMATYQW